jgi:hypothetical protein
MNNEISKFMYTEPWDYFPHSAPTRSLFAEHTHTHARTHARARAHKLHLHAELYWQKSSARVEMKRSVLIFRKSSISLDYIIICIYKA